LGRSTNKNSKRTHQTVGSSTRQPVKLLSLPPKNPSNFWGFRQKTRQTFGGSAKKTVKLCGLAKKSRQTNQLEKKKPSNTWALKKKAVKLVSLIQKKPSNCEVPPRMVNCDCLFKNPVTIWGSRGKPIVGSIFWYEYNSWLVAPQTRNLWLTFWKGRRAQEHSRGSSTLIGFSWFSTAIRIFTFCVISMVHI